MMIQPTTLRRFRPIGGFTLIEVLVVMSLILILAGIALPTTKELLNDQKASRAAHSIAAFISQARTDAISRGIHVGVRIERFNESSDVNYDSAASVRLFRITGVPPYTGEAADAKVQVTIHPTGIADLTFKSSDSLLLSLFEHSSDNNAPVSDGDLIELPGGRAYPIDFLNRYNDPSPNGPEYVSAQIDLNSPENGKVDPMNPSTRTFPAARLTGGTFSFPYRVHRKPVISASTPLSLPRGVVIDLNYSGIGIGGNQFVPTPQTSGVFNAPVDILFGPDGSVDFMTIDNVGNIGPPAGMVFLCLGTTDGVVEPTDSGTAATLEQLYENGRQFRANITSPESIWIVINPNTGRVVTSPFASLTGSPPSVAEGLAAARELASRSDTLEQGS